MMAVAVEAALAGREWMWTAPTYDQVFTGWTEARRAAGQVATFNTSRMEATFPGRGVILYRSLDDPDNARSKTADGITMDEAAEIDPRAWPEVLRAMLVDTGGELWAGFTPKGRNWVWHECEAAKKADDSVFWHAPVLGVEIANGRLLRKPHPLENPNIAFDELATIFERTPERVFRQEYMAEFVDDGGGVFRNVRACATATPQHDPIDGHTYAIGVDWGRSVDFTVMAVFDVTDKRMVWLDRSNQVEFAHQRGRLRALRDRYQAQTIIVEHNSMGIPIVEELTREDIAVQPWVASNATKMELIDSLALAFEKDAITILNDETLILELEAFEATRTPTGLVRYAAPAGFHDDTVIATALGWQACSTSPAYGAMIHRQTREHQSYALGLGMRGRR
jgi:hypothetical protein